MMLVSELDALPNEFGVGSIATVTADVEIVTAWGMGQVAEENLTVYSPQYRPLSPPITNTPMCD
ncbi:hypothetical protein BC938DRAFT_478879 [Jimgerdemannia flammicorona]|uniref:Uncharacterized protein n=1 Tax=Jimgerdemannia flammicorona TaxID=994334 RepID=A0A433QM51_9FUNG|nr:hypothetical protein BC938DRAFT_478879 [Jimgerdemannia flammicorona]